MTKKPNLFAAFERAMKNAPEGSRKEQFEAFLETVQSSPDYLSALATDYFDRQAAQWKIQQIGKSHSLVGTSTVQASAERRAESAARVERVHAELKAKLRAVILLDITLPNGKKLRDATGAECAKAGGFYAAVAKHVKPTQVVDKHLSEADLRNIQARFEGGKSTLSKTDRDA